MIHLTKHAKETIEKRGFDSSLILTKLNKIEAAINKAASFNPNATQIRVIVQKYSGYFERTGTGGDTLVACVDPLTKSVITVMLQKHKHIVRNMKQNDIYLEA